MNKSLKSSGNMHAAGHNRADHSVTVAKSPLHSKCPKKDCEAMAMAAVDFRIARDPSTIL